MLEDDDFLKELRSSFVEEAKEQLHTMTDLLLAVENAIGAVDYSVSIDKMFREAHSIKGSARAVNLPEVESICHAMESVFVALKDRQIALTAKLIDCLHRGIDGLALMLSEVEAGRPLERARDIEEAFETQLQELAGDKSLDGEEAGKADLESGESYQSGALAAVCAPNVVPDAVSAQPFVERRSTDTLRVPATKLDAILSQAEELLSIKALVRQHSVNSLELKDSLDPWSRQWLRIYPDIKSMRALLERSIHDPAQRAQVSYRWKKIMDFLESTYAFHQTLEGQCSSLNSLTEGTQRTTSNLVDSLLSETKRLLLMPCSTLFAGFTKLVRDLSKDLDKKVEFTIEGGEIQLDNRILVQIRDPLVHLLRNCIDHGIESPDVRTKAGKPPSGKLILCVEHLGGNKVQISVSDDGKGIDPEKVKQAAVAKQIITEGEVSGLSEDDVLRLIFAPDLSTSSTVSEISGRGLGMSIVKDAVVRLGGSVHIESKLNEGTSFQFDLPVTLATFKGILVRSGGQTLVVPTVSVARALRVLPSEMTVVDGRQCITIDGSAHPLLPLTTILNIPDIAQEWSAEEFRLVVLLEYDQNFLAVIADEILDEQEVLVKQLTRPLVRVRNIAGISILGSGRPVPVLNVSDIFKTASKLMREHTPSRVQTVEAKKKVVLVVDDTLTARILLKNILEPAGYVVQMAVDGKEALLFLKDNPVDVVLTDIEMPVMNGFELTSKIKADTELKEIPVILVTSRASTEDRERGVQAGADAYFVKSSLDKTNLLDVVKRVF